MEVELTKVWSGETETKQQRQTFLFSSRVQPQAVGRSLPAQLNSFATDKLLSGSVSACEYVWT